MGRAVWGLHPQRSPQRPRLTPGDTVCPGSRGQSCAGTFACPLSSAKLPLLRFKITRRIRSAPAPHGSAFRPRPLGCWRLTDPPLTTAGSQELCGAGERWGEGKGGPYSLLPPSGGGFRPRGLPCSATGSCVTRSALLSPPPSCIIKPLRPSPVPAGAGSVWGREAPSGVALPRAPRAPAGSSAGVWTALQPEWGSGRG